MTRLLLIPSLVLLLAGCATEPPHAPMGQSVRRAVAAQVLNPEAGGDAPVAGLDGRAGESVLKGYRDGFQPEKKEGAGDVFSTLMGGGKKK